MSSLSDKKDWILSIYGRLLNTLSPFIPRVDKPSEEEFLSRFYSANLPCVITNAISDWPALQYWSDNNYLRRVCGDNPIECQSNRNSNLSYERNKTAHKTSMLFKDFINLLEQNPESNNFYITAYNDTVNKNSLQALLQDTRQIPYLKDLEGWFWFGPKGTLTPLHHDLQNIFMVQVRGSKEVYLTSPCYIDNIYNDHFCFSNVDLSNIDYYKYPMMKGVPVFKAIINPGDILFLPIGWWHQVKSLDISITMTYVNFKYFNDFHIGYNSFGAIS